MNPIEAVTSVLRDYATFRGRARRAEYWWWTLARLVLTVLACVLVLLVDATGVDLLSTALGVTLVVGYLGLLLPSLAVTVRRLHDTGRSGWWYLIAFVPLGGLVLLGFECTESTPGPNRFGPNPKGVHEHADPYQQYAGHR
ncbi:DUF805 domain-containing protein [Kineococcus sp. SYSU DK002]|uniref:DUF805 domain-containing protein n=1 Tax=Kineococcus sp. SYSU DK002 TaxID=3383123 RepID=UPI003D7D5D1A